MLRPEDRRYIESIMPVAVEIKKPFQETTFWELKANYEQLKEFIAAREPEDFNDPTNGDDLKILRDELEKLNP